MKTIFKPVLLGLCIAAGWAQAQNLPAQLVQAGQAALSQSPDVQERWKALLGARQGVPIARSGWLPQVDLQAYAGRQERRTPGQNFGWYSIGGVELSLNQLLFDGGVVSGAMAQASEAERAAYHDLMSASEAVASRVVQAYLDLLRMQERVALATDHYVEHKRTFDAMNERSNAAVGRRADTEQAQGRLALAESNLAAETTALREAGLAYQRYVGQMPPGNLPAWTEGRNLSPLPANVLTTLQQGLSGSPLVRSAYHRWKASEQAVAQREAVFMPRIDARISAAESRNRNGTTGDYSDQLAEIRLSQNIYRGGADSAALRRATELQAKSRADMDTTCREVQQTLSVAFNDVQTLSIRERLVDTQRLASEKSTTAFRQQFDIGQRTLLDLLDTQAEYYDTARNYIDVRHDQLRAEARTLAAMGRLVALFGVEPAGDASLSDAGSRGADMDMADLCPAQETFMDSLERIKASLDVPKKVLPQDYVVLLPNADGTVGKVVVTGPGGMQTLTAPRSGAEIGSAKVIGNVAENQITADFGNAIDAQPQLPERFTLYFDSGSTRLSKDSEAQWPAVLSSLKARKALDITVSGHTDTVSTSKINETLALKRAKTIAQRLRSNGFKDTEIAIEGYGARDLAVDTPPQTKEPRNRRVVIIAR